MIRSAVISPCGRFRYRAVRVLGRGPTLVVVMVNPSTADGEKDDATVRKLIGFATRWGFGRVIIVNLFAFRATDVRELATAPDPVGPENALHVAQALAEADAVLCAWGPTAKLPRGLRDQWRTMALLREPLCIGTAKDGQPLHPLMVSYAEPLRLWRPPC